MIRVLKRILLRAGSACIPARHVLLCSIQLSLLLAAGALLVLVTAGDFRLDVLYIYRLADAMADTVFPVSLIGVIGSVLIEERMMQ